MQGLKKNEKQKCEHEWDPDPDPEEKQRGRLFKHRRNRRKKTQVHIRRERRLGASFFFFISLSPPLHLEMMNVGPSGFSTHLSLSRPLALSLSVFLGFVNFRSFDRSRIRNPPASILPFAPARISPHQSSLRRSFPLFLQTMRRCPERSSSPPASSPSSSGSGTALTSSECLTRQVSWAFCCFFWVGFFGGFGTWVLANCCLLCSYWLVGSPRAIDSWSGSWKWWRVLDGHVSLDDPFAFLFFSLSERWICRVSFFFLLMALIAVRNCHFWLYGWFDFSSCPGSVVEAVSHLFLMSLLEVVVFAYNQQYGIWSLCLYTPQDYWIAIWYVFQSKQWISLNHYSLVMVAHLFVRPV